MKKLALAIGLFVSSIASANVVFEASIKTNEQEVVVEPAVLTAENNSALYAIGDVVYKVVLMNFDKNEEGNIFVSLSIAKIDENGNESIVRLLEFNNLPAALAVSNGESLVVINVKENEVIA